MKTFFVIASRLVFDVHEVAANDAGQASSKVYHQPGVRDTHHVYEDEGEAYKMTGHLEKAANNHPRLL